jgi:hypothetical protein
MSEHADNEDEGWNYWNFKPSPSDDREQIELEKGDRKCRDDRERE